MMNIGPGTRFVTTHPSFNIHNTVEEMLTQVSLFAEKLDIESATKLLLKLSDDGCVVAQKKFYSLLEKSGEAAGEALNVCINSDENGSPTASYFLAIMYLSGLGVPQDDKKAFDYYKKADEKGMSPRAAYCVGCSYLHGSGVEKDYHNALAYFNKAKDQHIPDAFYKLGSMYEHGQGVAKNYRTALDYYRAADLNGVVGASGKILAMCITGRAYRFHPQVALEYLNTASKAGNEAATEKLQEEMRLDKEVDEKIKIQDENSTWMSRLSFHNQL